MYHKVHPDTPTIWWVSVNDFYRQMSELSNKKVVYLDEYDKNNSDHIVITFDGVYNNVLEYAVPILNFFDYPYELFITSDYIGLDNNFDKVEPLSSFTSIEDLKQLVLKRARLQWHTKTHQNLKELKDIDAIKLELDIPEDLKALDPNGFTWFAYPYGEFNEVVVDEVKKRFLGAVSCNQGDDTNQYILNRLTVVNETKLRKNKIACIVASYNYGQYLIEAIESVLRQTILPDEILISDDFSDDDTETISNAYVKKYPQLIRYSRNGKNLGVVDHFNKAISLVKAEYVFFLGADNRLLSNYVEECAKILDRDSNNAIAYTDYAFFGSRAKLAYMKFPKIKQGLIHENTFFQVHFPSFQNKEELISEMQKGNFIHGSSMFRKKVFDEVGGYIKSTKAEDYHLFQRMVNSGWNAEKAIKTSLEYRQHSVSQVNNLVSLYNSLNLYKELYSKKEQFEKSRIYKLAYKIYILKKIPKKLLVKKIIKKIKG